MKLARSLCSLAALLLAACSPPSEPDAGVCDDGTPSLELGFGNADNPLQFRPLRDGDHVQLTPGNQGGQHLWLVLRERGLCSPRPFAAVRMFDPATNASVSYAIATGANWQRPFDRPEYLQSELLAAPIETSRYCPLLRNGELRIEAFAGMEAGASATATVRVVVDGWASEAASDLVGSRNACCADVNNTRCWPNGPPPLAEAGAESSVPDASMDAPSGP